jgi:hypothetical protein
MDHMIEINPLNSRVLYRGIRGLSNVQYLLNVDTEQWLNGNTPGWRFLDANRFWEVPLQTWFHYRDALTGLEHDIGPAKFLFRSADHALLFKLTWG